VSGAANSHPMPLPRLETGQVVATPGALRMLEQVNVAPMALLARHVFGDWGDLCSEDKEANDQAVRCGGRVFSSYEIGSEPGGPKVWLITEHDRSVTTFLLPEEY